MIVACSSNGYSEELHLTLRGLRSGEKRTLRVTGESRAWAWVFDRLQLCFTSCMFPLAASELLGRSENASLLIARDHFMDPLISGRTKNNPQRLTC